MSEDTAVMDEVETADGEKLAGEVGSEIKIKTSGRRARKAAEEKAAKAEKPAKAPREKGPYSGLSQHQRNRRLAWDKYGPGGEYDANARYVIDPALRAEIHQELAEAHVRPSATNSSFGGDRYLQGVAKRGWPEGAITILTGDQQVAAKAQRELAKAEAAAAKAVERERAKAEREAAKAASEEAVDETAEAEEVEPFES